jgi:TRAP-type transport system large permease protein
MTWVLVAFVLFLLMGMPVAFAIGIAGCVFFLQHPELPSTIPIQLTVSQTQNFALLAIPLFIMAGNFLNHSGITRELLNLATVIARPRPGGRPHGGELGGPRMGGG